MTEKRIIVRTINLERAIRTVIHDLRIPKKLRTALAFYQDQRADLNNGKIFMLRTRQTETTCPPTAAYPSVAEVCQQYNSQRSANEDCFVSSCGSAAIERELKICMRHHDESLDWSIEINGQRHEHVTSDVMEALVECAMIIAETSLTRALASRPQ
jgi:hypothetical protein